MARHERLDAHRDVGVPALTPRDAGRPRPGEVTADPARTPRDPGRPHAAAQPHAARVPALVGAVWTLLIINTLGSTGAVTVVPIPRSVIQLVTMGSLMGALALAVALNPGLRLRPSVYLLLLTLLLVVAIVASSTLVSGLGSLFRCFRLTVFVATLWLLTRWWDGGLTFVRHHIRALSVVLLTAAVGLVVAPGLARPELYGGRLVDAVWPLTPPQVGQYAAIVAGLTLLLRLNRLTDARSTLVIVPAAIVLLLLSHTRTATLGLVAGLVVAVFSQALTSARARRAFAWTVLTSGLVAVAGASMVQAWFLRGQSQENFSNLTGRAKVWDALLSTPRSAFQHYFGVGLTNKSFDGLPIDSSWLAVYHEEGYLGIAIVVSFLAVLLVLAVLRPPSPARACALFLIVYCLLASYTEAGLSDASPYLLHLAIAAGLLARGAPVPGPAAAGRAPAPTRGSTAGRPTAGGPA